MFDPIPNSKTTLDRATARRVAAVVILLAVTLFGGLYLLTPSTVPWSFANGKLQIRSRVWSNEVPLNELEIARARVLDLERDSNWKPQAKQFGYNGFGYDAGRFKLRNGDLAEVYLASETHAILIPRHDKIPVMIGVRDPALFLQELKSASTP